MSIGPKTSSRNPYVRDPSFPGRPIQSAGKDILVGDTITTTSAGNADALDVAYDPSAFSHSHNSLHNINWDELRRLSGLEDMLKKPNPVPRRYSDITKEIEKNRQRIKKHQDLLERVEKDLESFPLVAGDFGISREHGKCVILNPVSIAIEELIHPASIGPSRVFPEGFTRGYEILVIQPDTYYGTTVSEKMVRIEDIVPYSKEAVILYEKKT